MNGANDGTLIEMIVLRLADFHVASTVVLAVALLVGAALRQPARRLALAWGACGATALLVALSMVPGWSVLHLWSAPEEAAISPEKVTIAQPAATRSGRPSPEPSPEPFPAPSDTVAALPVAPSAPAVAPAPNLGAAPLPAGLPAFDWQASARSVGPVALLGLAMLGSLAAGAWLAWGSWVARRLIDDATPADDRLNAMLAELATDLETTRTPRLLVSDRLGAAVAIGLARPTVLLPERLVAKASPGDLRSVLAHELAHLSGGDLWLLAAMRVLLVAVWPNPLFWLLRRRVRLDQETLADAAAAERTDRHAYAEQLVGWARELSASSAPRGPRLAGAAGIWEGPSQLRSRVAVLLDERFTVLRRCGAAWRVTSGVACAALAVGASLVTLSPATPSPSTTAPTSEPEAALTGEAPRGTATLAGRIVFADGSPSTAKGWYYSGSQQENHSSYNTQGQLESRFECEVEAGVVNLRFFPDDGYAPAVAGPFELEPGDERRDLVVTLVPGYSSPLHLVDGQGEPVAGATVSAFPLLNGSTNGPVHKQVTDVAGELILKHLAPGVPYVFRAKAAGHQPLRTEPLRMQNRANPVELTLLRARPATGVVRFVDGSVCPGSKLMTFSTVSPSDGANSYATPEQLAVTDSEGRFTLDSLEDDAHHLILVEAMDQTRAFVTDIEAGDEGVQVVLPERHDLVVRVRGDLDRLPKRDGKPYVRVQQRVHADSVSELLTWEAAIKPVDGDNRERDGGEAIFRGLAIDLRPDAGPQEVQVSLQLDPPQSKAAPIARDADRATFVEFDLRPAGKTFAVAPGGQETLKLAVRVVDEAGDPVAGAEVKPWALQSSQGHRTWDKGDKQSSLSPAEAKTDAQGRAVIRYPAFSYLDERVRTVAVSLWVDHPGYAFAGELHVDVPREAEGPYEVMLKRGAVVELRPLVDGQPVATDGLHVLSSDSRAWNPNFKLSTEEGLLRAPVMPAGPGVVRVVQLEAGRATRFSRLISLELKAGQTVRRDVELKPAVTVRGRLGDEAPRPIRDGRVKASGLRASREGPACTWFTWAPVAEDGTFEITGWPADETLQLIALCDGYLATNGAAPPEETETPDPDPYLRAHVFTPDRFGREVVLPMEPLVPCRVTAVDQAGDPVAGVEVASYPNVQWWNSGSQIYCDNLYRLERFLVTHDYRASIDRGDTPEFNQTTDAEGVATLQLPKGRGSLYVNRSEAYELPIRLGSRRVDVKLKPGEVTEARLVLQPKGTERLGDADKGASVPREGVHSPMPAEAPADRSTPTEAEAPLSLRGRLTTDTGEPLAGVKVTLYSGVATLSQGQETTTSEDGRYEFTPLRTGLESQGADSNPSRYHLMAKFTHPEYVPADGRSMRRITFVIEPGHVETLDLPMTRGGWLRGVVADHSTHEPLAELPLRVHNGFPGNKRTDGLLGPLSYSTYATTDSWGAFQSEPLFPGDYIVEINDNDYHHGKRYPRIGKGTVVAGGTTELSLEDVEAPELINPFVISGTAYGEDGEKMVYGGVGVRLSDGGAVASQGGGVDGRPIYHLRFGPVDRVETSPTAPYGVGVRDVQLVASNRRLGYSLASREPSEPLRITDNPDRSQDEPGYYYIRPGRPHGIKLIFKKDPPEEPNQPEEENPASAESPTTVAASPEVDTEAPAEGAVFAPADPARPVTRPDTPELVRGECLDAAGGPVVGAEVMAYRHDTRSGVSTLLKATRTDDNGRFSFDNPIKDVGAQNTTSSNTNPVFLMVTARKAGLVSQTTAELAVDIARNGLHARFVMPAAATVRGRVVDPEGRPVEGALVRAELMNGIGAGANKSIHSGVTDADGRYAINDLPPSDFEALRREEERRRDEQLNEMKKSQAEGGASFNLFVSPTQRLITVTHPDYARTRTPLERAPGEVDLRMLAKAAVVGRVVDDAGDPVVNAGVMIATRGRNWAGEQPTPAEIASELGRQYHARGLTDDAGEYRFENLPAGDYGVQYLMAPERGRLPDRIPVSSVRVEAVASGGLSEDENEGATRAPDLRLTEGRLVRVQLVDDATGDPLHFDKPMAASVYFRPAGDLTGGVSNGEAPVAADGTFTCRLLSEAGDLSVFQLHEKDRFESMSQWRTETTVRVAAEGELGDSVVHFPVSPGTVSLGWYIEEASQLASRGRPEEAIDLLNEQLQVRPANVSLLIKRAEIARGWGRDAEAIADYETILQAAPDTWFVLNNLSDALVNAKDEALHDPPRALRLAERALELLPEPHSMVFDTLAAAQAANGDLAAAIKTQEKAIELAPARLRPGLQERLKAYQSRLR